MRFLGFLAAVTVSGLCLAPAGAAPEYVLRIENPSTMNYQVEVHDQSRIRTAAVVAGKSVTFTLATQTPRVTVIGTGCSESVTPSIKTYVTLALKANCKIETKAAGVSGF